LEKAPRGGTSCFNPSKLVELIFHRRRAQRRVLPGYFIKDENPLHGGGPGSGIPDNVIMLQFGREASSNIAFSQILR